MPIERSTDHPMFELGGNAITSFDAPPRGSGEVALYRADVPGGGGLPPHLEAGSEGASLLVAMVPGTKLFRDDGSEIVPEWVR
jgi:hypothetical protein